MTNYFAFFDLPVHPQLDESDLRRRFLANSKRFHPDFHTLEATERQAEVLELSTLNNQAYQVLKDPDRRLRHLLAVKDVFDEEGQNTIPRDFLSEVMEINEQLMELEFDPDPKIIAQAQHQIDQLERGLKQSVAQLLSDYDDTTVTDADLQAIKDYYFKQRYLLRIRENLAKFAAH